MRRARVVAAIVLAGLSLSMPTAFAQSWAKEPTTVFNIPLGAELPAGLYPKCPPKDYSYRTLPSTAPCFQSLARDMIAFKGHGIPGIDEAATIFMSEGQVRSIFLEGDHDSFGRLRLMLEERYGPPTSRQVDEVKTQGGGSFKSAELTWKGVTNSINLTERSGRVDRFLAVFSNNALSEKEAQVLKERLSKDASKF